MAIVKKLWLPFAPAILLTAVFFINSKSADTAVLYEFDPVAFEFKPSAPVVGQKAVVKVKIKNSGDIALASNAGLNDYSYTFHNFETQKVTLPSISSPVEKGKFFYYEFEGLFTKIGTTTISFSFNLDNFPAEMDTTDNYIEKTFQVLKQNNFVTESITLFPAYPAFGADCTITAKVKNGGFVDLVSNFGLQSYKYYFQDFLVEGISSPKLSDVSPLPVSSSTAFSFRGKFTSPGEKELKFEIDTGNEVDENNESDNLKTAKANVGSPSTVDLKMDSISFAKDKDKLLVNDIFKITVSIKNNSNFSLTSETGFLERDYGYASGGDYTVNFKNFDILSVSHDDYPSAQKPLDPGKIFKYTFEVKAIGPGSGEAEFTIDSKNKLKEADEANNTISTSYMIYRNAAERDDFQILGLRVMPAGSSSMVMAWETNNPADGTAYYKEKSYIDALDRYLIRIGLKAWPGHTDKTLSHKVTLKNLKPATPHFYQIKSAGNNVTRTTDWLEFTTPADDKIRISAGPAVAVDNQAKTAVFKWGTDLYGTAEVFYKAEGAKDFKSAKAPFPDVSHTVTISKLPIGTYEYYAQSVTEAKASVKSEIGRFSVTGAEAPQVQAGQSAISVLTETNGSSWAEKIKITNKFLYNRLKGRIILKVENKGEAYYLNPELLEMYFLNRPDDAFSVMRAQGRGITSADLEKIAIGLATTSGPDSDSDGLSDILEDAIGTQKSAKDTDGDGFDDYSEIKSGYNPKKGGGAKITVDSAFASRQKGKIFLQVEGKGEAWYVNPADGKRYFLGRPADAFSVMRNLGLGVADNDFNSLIK